MPACTVSTSAASNKALRSPSDISAALYGSSPDLVATIVAFLSTENSKGKLALVNNHSGPQVDLRHDLSVPVPAFYLLHGMRRLFPDSAGFGFVLGRILPYSPELQHYDLSIGRWVAWPSPADEFPPVPCWRRLGQTRQTATTSGDAEESSATSSCDQNLGGGRGLIYQFR